MRTLSSALSLATISILLITTTHPAHAADSSPLEVHSALTAPEVPAPEVDLPDGVVMQTAEDGSEFWVDDSLRELPTTGPAVLLMEVTDEGLEALEAAAREQLEASGVELDAASDETVPSEWVEPDNTTLDAAGACDIPLGALIDDALAACAQSTETPEVFESTEPETNVGDGDPALSPDAEAAPLAARAAGPSLSCTGATTQVKYLSRTKACFAVNRVIYLYNNKGQTVGSFRFEAVTTTQTRARQADIFNDTSVRITARTGAALSKAFIVKGSYACTSGCGSPSGAFNSVVSAVWETASGRSAHNVGTDPRIVRENWKFSITAPFVFFRATPTAVAVGPRCDRSNVPGMGPGCVYPQVSPVMTFTRSSAEGAHVAKAIASGLPSTLNRATQVERAANNRKACPSSLVKDSGFQCDEYPFASTRQGAASGGSQRILPGCRWTPVSGSGSVGYSICMIPAAANLAGGRTINDFYRNEHVITGDKFTVKVL